MLFGAGQAFIGVGARDTQQKSELVVLLGYTTVGRLQDQDSKGEVSKEKRKMYSTIHNRKTKMPEYQYIHHAA